MNRKNVSLECEICKKRNYKIRQSKEKPIKDLKIKKYCSYCKGHTLHVVVK